MKRGEKRKKGGKEGAPKPQNPKTPKPHKYVLLFNI
jgi:hypothetical protein